MHNGDECATVAFKLLACANKEFYSDEQRQKCKNIHKRFPMHPAVCYNEIEQRPMKHMSHAQ